MNEQPNRTIIEYASPQPVEVNGVGKIPVSLAKLLAMFVIGLFLVRFPTGEWRLGRQPQLFVAMDVFGLTVGRCDSAGRYEEEYLYLPLLAFLVAKLLIVGLPSWVIVRLYALRKHRRAANSPGDRGLTPHPKRN